jgi:hypothetical protein
MIVHTDDEHVANEMKQAMAARQRVVVPSPKGGESSVEGYVWSVCDDHTPTPQHWTIDVRDKSPGH